ncbi:hypothetical protein LIER_09275 [Lithospermum erythrorhizon]|uniref:Uncharacterized protein n=1 Tax=Lithospermum erythrorhizon TaxID=34254 RepID=A0AAV3PGD1_LITER
MVTMEKNPHQATYMVDFTIMDMLEVAYNGTIGRPWLSQFEACLLDSFEDEDWSGMETYVDDMLIKRHEAEDRDSNPRKDLRTWQGTSYGSTRTNVSSEKSKMDRTKPETDLKYRSPDSVYIQSRGSYQ